jgi:hypothetical protein
VNDHDTKRKNIFKTCISCKGIESIPYIKNAQYSIVTKTNNPIRKLAKDMSRHYTEVDRQIAKKAHEKIFNVINSRKWPSKAQRCQ